MASGRSFYVGQAPSGPTVIRPLPAYKRGPTSSPERRAAQHITHACLINDSSEALANLSHHGGLTHWASLRGRP